MPIVFACAGSHAPGIRAWTERAPQQQVEHLFGGYASVREALGQARPEIVLLLSSEHWANFFEHVGAFCVGRGDSFDGPVEPWLRVQNATVKGDPAFATRLLEHCYANGFEPSFTYEMQFDHGSMVPLSFLTPAMDVRVVPIMFNALATPRPTSARCLALGRTLRPFLEQAPERIAVVATGGLSHDPGERNHGIIDTDFDARFIADMTSADPERLARYSDADLLRAGAGTLELLAWICLAGIMGAEKARLVAYEAVKPWATGMGIVSYDRAA
jgi:aromatic ring-opening dioxygenase catalytic subunit (LigB family)